MTDREKLRGHAQSADHEVVLLRGLEDLLSGTLVACENLQQILGSYLIPLIIDHHSFIHVRRVAGIVVELAWEWIRWIKRNVVVHHCDDVVGVETSRFENLVCVRTRNETREYYLHVGVVTVVIVSF